MSVDVSVELFIEDTWTDITAYVRDDPGVEITFGIANEGGTADPSECRMVLLNTDGRFTPRNTSGPYYPWITRNIPVRVSVGAAVRFYGYLSAAPITWNHNESYVSVTATANGVMRRLARANDLTSTLRSGLVSIAAADPDVTGYWPAEDLPGSTSIASGLATGTPGVLGGVAPAFAAIDPGVMSLPVPDWTGASASFTPAAGSSTGFTAGFLLTLPTSGMTGGEELFRVNVSGTALSWRVLYSPSFGGNLLLQVIDSGGAEALATGISSEALDGKTFYVKLEAINDGADVDYFLDTLGVTGGSSGTLAGHGVGAPTAASVGAGTIAIAGAAGIGHVILADSNDALLTYGFDQALVGYAGETVKQRCDRLAAQTGIPITELVGDSEYAELGAQPDGTLLEILRDMEKANYGGILRDSLNDPGLVYSSRSSRFNQAATLVLDYAAGHISPPLSPTDDDQQLRNDITITRTAGSSARVELATGALSVQDYPDGAGRYPFADTLNVYSDDQLPYLADWVLALGTIDEPRWPQVTIDLVANPSLVADWDDMRPGWRITLENLPAVSGVADVDLHCIGWTETITTTRRTVTMNCVPGTIWGVPGNGLFILDDATYGELDANRLAL